MSDLLLAERQMYLRVEEEHHKAELRRLAREARQAQPGWVSRQRCRLLCQVGLVLASAGRQLPAVSARSALPGTEQARV